MTVEIAAREVVFHYNKHNLVDPTVPMWVLKTNGKTYHINHVESDLPWSTKETQNNPSTKGSIKFKKALITIDDDNGAKLTRLTLADVTRLKSKSFTRILIIVKDTVLKFINDNDIRHTEIKEFRGHCGSRFHICDIQKTSDIVTMQLGISSGKVPYNGFFRILQENESYYKVYTDDTYLSDVIGDYEEGVYDDEDDNEDES